MDLESIGIMMEIYTLGDGRMTMRLKERCTSCNRMALIFKYDENENEIDREEISKGHKLV
jgi:hypothetical protein